MLLFSYASIVSNRKKCQAMLLGSIAMTIVNINIYVLQSVEFNLEK